MGLARYLDRHFSIKAEESLTRVGGLDFEVTKAGAGSKLALCLHGFPEHAISWRFQVPLLANMGYRVWVPNLRGYGASDTPQRKAAYGIDRLLADVAGLIEKAREDQEVSEVVILAHDWGALIAWEFAMRKVAPIDRLIIMNVPHPAVAMRHSRQWYQLKKSWYIFMFQIPGLPEWGLRRDDAQGLNGAFTNSAQNKENFPEEVLSVYRKNVLREGGPTGMINYYRANFAPGNISGFNGKAPPLIEIPVLMIWGENDIALDVRLTEGTDAFVKDLTIRHLPGISHWVQQDAPQTTNALIEPWLSDAPVPRIGDFDFPLK